MVEGREIETAFKTKACKITRTQYFLKPTKQTALLMEVTIYVY